MSKIIDVRIDVELSVCRKGLFFYTFGLFFYKIIDVRIDVKNGCRKLLMLGLMSKPGVKKY